MVVVVVLCLPFFFSSVVVDGNRPMKNVSATAQLLWCIEKIAPLCLGCIYGQCAGHGRGVQHPGDAPSPLSNGREGPGGSPQALAQRGTAGGPASQQW
jgi:hypothetical protein